MTSQLNVDTIVDKAGSGGSNVKMANTSTYVSDGGSATQNTVQGLAKMWVNFNGTGTIATRDSLNVASLTDTATGNYIVNLSSNMDTADSYAVVKAGDVNNGNDDLRRNERIHNITASAIKIACGSNPDASTNSKEDWTHVYMAALGDLA